MNGEEREKIEKDKNDQREFDYRLSRLNARESSSITLAGIASSASLVFLGFSINHPDLRFTIIGILFICAGFAYNEITCRTLLKDDNDYFGKIPKGKDRTGYRILRLFASRTLLLLPILGWIYGEIWSNYYGCIIVGLFIVAVTAFVLTHPNAGLICKRKCQNPET